MLGEMDEEELAYQMAYDLVEADELKQRVAASGSGPRPASVAQWIDLTDPDAYTKLKWRMGMV